MPTFDFKIANKKVIGKETPKTHGFKTIDLKRICVYAHYYDDEQNPFYIGQGTISRAFSFSDNIRNKSWKDKVKQKELVHVKIINIDITIEESIAIEKELIKKYGLLIDNTGCLTNENNGGKNCQIGKDNYFYDKHFIGEDNSNYGNKYNLNSNSKPILQINIMGDIIKEWSSATEAEEKGGFIASCINLCCIGKRHIHKNYQWIYKKDFNDKFDYEYIPGKTNNGIYIGFPIGHIGDITKIIILYNTKQAASLGFRLANVNQVCHGNKKSHKGYVFKNFFDMCTYDKHKYLPYINIDSN